MEGRPWEWDDDARRERLERFIEAERATARQILAEGGRRIARERAIAIAKAAFAERGFDLSDREAAGHISLWTATPLQFAFGLLVGPFSPAPGGRRWRWRQAARRRTSAP